MAGEPFRELGLTAAASAEDVRRARRLLAKTHHPDAGGDAARMSAVNDAAAAALRLLATPASEADSARTDNAPERDSTGITRDVSSFTVEVLPAEAFEALLVVTSWLGEVLDDDPPYRLDIRLYEPTECWCRLEIVPEAGASTVSLSVAAYDARPVPDVELIRDVWVENLNRYNW